MWLCKKYYGWLWKSWSSIRSKWPMAVPCARMINSVSHRQCSGSGPVCKIDVALFLRGGNSHAQLMMLKLSAKQSVKSKGQWWNVPTISYHLLYASQDRHTGPPWRPLPWSRALESARVSNGASSSLGPGVSPQGGVHCSNKRCEVESKTGNRILVTTMGLVRSVLLIGTH